MAMFITRVELHDASWTDYQTLHEAMEAQKFHRIIKGNDGKWYDLPLAEYWSKGEVTTEFVREAARQAAVSTGRRYSVVVSNTSEVLWLNLSQAK